MGASSEVQTRGPLEAGNPRGLDALEERIQDVHDVTGILSGPVRCTSWNQGSSRAGGNQLAGRDGFTADLVVINRAVEAFGRLRWTATRGFITILDTIWRDGRVVKATVC